MQGKKLTIMNLSSGTQVILTRPGSLSTLEAGEGRVSVGMKGGGKYHLASMRAQMDVAMEVAVRDRMGAGSHL